MGEIIPVIQAILNGIKNPIKAGIGAVLALFLYLFILIQKGNFRDKKAEADKNEQKGESNIDLENTNADADRSVRDRLDRKS